MTLRVLQVCGVRPNVTKFINITGRDIVANTGQHFSPEMLCGEINSHYNLNQTEIGRMISALILILEKEKPDLVVIYGDTRSALAGALAADQLNIQLCHIEAGVRLGDMRRPEERTRKLIDSIADFLFCVNDFHAENLERENVSGQIFIVGDLHYDRYLQNRPHKGHTLITIH
ncbi:MAG: UDP-N-acetylglucosamine 2-epimerase, partial [Patescibacteria group bacterium]